MLGAANYYNNKHKKLLGLIKDQRTTVISITFGLILTFSAWKYLKNKMCDDMKSIPRDEDEASNEETPMSEDEDNSSDKKFNSKSTEIDKDEGKATQDKDAFKNKEITRTDSDIVGEDVSKDSSAKDQCKEENLKDDKVDEEQPMSQGPDNSDEKLNSNKDIAAKKDCKKEEKLKEGEIVEKEQPMSQDTDNSDEKFNSDVHKDKGKDTTNKDLPKNIASKKDCKKENLKEGEIVEGQPMGLDTDNFDEKLSSDIDDKDTTNKDLPKDIAAKKDCKKENLKDGDIVEEEQPMSQDTDNSDEKFNSDIDKDKDKDTTNKDLPKDIAGKGDLKKEENLKEGEIEDEEEPMSQDLDNSYEKGNTRGDSDIGDEDNFTVTTDSVENPGIMMNRGIKVIIKCGNITHEKVDVIVNAANGRLAHGGGVARAIAVAAGSEIDKEGRKKLNERGSPLKVSEVLHTKGYNLNAKFVVHAVGPMRGMDNPFRSKLENTFYNCMKHADEDLRAKSIAIPLISSGIFGGQKMECAKALIHAINKFSEEMFEHLKEIRLVNIDYEATDAIKKCAEDLKTVKKA